jgi:hypothetical protein
MEKGDPVTMTELYSEKDINQINAQLKKRYTIIFIVFAIIIVLVIWSFIVRIEWLSMVSVFLAGVTLVFGIDLFCLPLHRYRKLMTSALTGRTHVGTFEFKQAEADVSMVDGISCRSLIFLGEPDKHGSREQRFYWDANHPLPDFHPGDQITLKYTGRNIIGWSEGV